MYKFDSKTSCVFYEYQSIVSCLGCACLCICGKFCKNARNLWIWYIYGKEYKMSNVQYLLLHWQYFAIELCAKSMQKVHCFN